MWGTGLCAAGTCSGVGGTTGTRVTHLCRRLTRGGGTLPAGLCCAACGLILSFVLLLFPWPHGSGPKINQLPQGSNPLVSVSSAGASPPAAAFLFGDLRGHTHPAPGTLSGTLTAGALTTRQHAHGPVSPEPTVLSGFVGEPTPGCCQASRGDCSHGVGRLAARFRRHLRERQG